MLLPGADLAVEFTLRHPTTGAAADADSTPTGVLVRNGDNTGETVTITNKSTGAYKAATAIPDDWAAGDVVQIRGNATVGGVTDNWIIWQSTLDSAAAGSGARTVTITVDDGTDPIEGARVRVTQGAETYVVSTDADGEAVFALDDATWGVAITKALYAFTPTTLVVDGDETRTYSMTAQSLPSPGSALQTTAYLYLYDANGDPVEGGEVSFLLHNSDGTTGRAYDNDAVVATSDASGLVSLTLLKSTRYVASYGTGRVQFTTGTGSTYAIPELVG